jgi:S-formylglutathione hydrolase
MLFPFSSILYLVQHLIHIQGTGDNFYKQGQLLPENFEAAARDAGIEGLKVRYQPDYDHSYYTMATFADDHVEHAAKYLFA